MAKEGYWEGWGFNDTFKVNLTGKTKDVSSAVKELKQAFPKNEVKKYSTKSLYVFVYDNELPIVKKIAKIFNLKLSYEAGGLADNDKLIYVLYDVNDEADPFLNAQGKRNRGWWISNLNRQESERLLNDLKRQKLLLGFLIYTGDRSNLKFEQGGNIGEALATSNPYIGGAKVIQGIAPESVSALDKKMASRINPDPNRPIFFNKGGKTPKEKNFENYKKAVEIYIKEKYNEDVDWSESMILFNNSTEQTQIIESYIVTKNGKQYDVSNKDLFSAFERGGLTKMKAQQKVAKVMREFKQGTLYSSSGQKVTDRKQAIAIALSEAGLSKYAEGGRIDLFEDYENIPPEIQEILDFYEDDFVDGNYNGLSKALKEVEAKGYTFEYYLDGEAYGLRPIGVKLNELRGYEDEEYSLGGGVDIIAPFGTLVSKNKKQKLEYKKVGSNFEFMIYEGVNNPVSNYSRTSFKKSKNGSIIMNYYEFLKFIHSNGFVDDQKYSLGGGVENSEIKKILERLERQYFVGRGLNLETDIKQIQNPIFAKDYWENDKFFKGQLYQWLKKYDIIGDYKIIWVGDLQKINEWKSKIKELKSSGYLVTSKVSAPTKDRTKQYRYIAIKQKFDNGGSVGQTDYSVAQIILNQLGGMKRLVIMTGAYNFVASSNSVSFRIKNRKVNYIKITLNGKDLYDVKFSRIFNYKEKVVAELNDIYFDQLIPIFEQNTGMYLKMFKKGGMVSTQNRDMVISQLKTIHHHEQEMLQTLKNSGEVEAWVLAKVSNASSDLSDIAHYLEFKG